MTDQTIHDYFSRQSRDHWNRQTPEQRAARLARLQEAKKAAWDALTQEQKEERTKKWREAGVKARLEKARKKKEQYP